MLILNSELIRRGARCQIRLPATVKLCQTGCTVDVQQGAFTHALIDGLGIQGKLFFILNLKTRFVVLISCSNRIKYGTALYKNLISMSRQAPYLQLRFPISLINLILQYTGDCFNKLDVSATLHIHLSN
jgi:hypothetical protein